jgi:ankyrin repeat protein
MRFGVTIYNYYAYLKSVHMAINLLSFVSPFLQPQNNTALILASDNGHVEVVKLLLALPGIDYNQKGDEVWCRCHYKPFFMYASKIVHMTITPLSFAVCFYTQNDTALICASDKGHVEVVKLLLALPGIEYNHKNNEVEKMM